jgi:MoxR-like ATPase
VEDEDYDNNILPSLSRNEDSQPKFEAYSSGHQRIADVVVAKNLHITHPKVQIQALELIRGKRIFTRKAVHATPKRFLFIALLPSGDGSRLIPQLNDHMFISHNHSTPDDNEDEESIQLELSISDNASESSIIRSTPITPVIAMPKSRSVDPNHRHTITKSDIDLLIDQITTVRLDSEVRSYIHNIAIFLRMHRAIAGGISALSTRHLLSLSHALAPLHGLSYVSPSLVALAARKVYSHRILLARPENERSMMWGSNVRAVRALLEGLTVEDVIEDVLGNVEMPL